MTGRRLAECTFCSNEAGAGLVHVAVVQRLLLKLNDDLQALLRHVEKLDLPSDYSSIHGSFQVEPYEKQTANAEHHRISLQSTQAISLPLMLKMVARWSMYLKQQHVHRVPFTAFASQYYLKPNAAGCMTHQDSLGCLHNRDVNTNHQ